MVRRGGSTASVVVMATTRMSVTTNTSISGTVAIGPSVVVIIAFITSSVTWIPASAGRSTVPSSSSTSIPGR